MKKYMIVIFAVCVSVVSHAVSPNSVKNLVFTFSATNSTGSYSSNGTFNLLPHKSDNRYWIIALDSYGVDSKGTYTYSKTGENTGTVINYDETFGATGSISIIFNTDTSGAFSISSDLGTQAGTFTIDYRYNESEVQNVGLGDVIIKANANGSVAIDFKIKNSSDLENWNDSSGIFSILSGNAFRWEYSPVSEWQFFRFQLNPNF